MRDFEEVMAGVRGSPEHQRLRRATAAAGAASIAGLAGGGLMLGGGLTAMAALPAARTVAAVAVVLGLGAAWLGARGLERHRRSAAAADRALFLDALRHARTLGELRACGFIDPSEFMFDLMPVEEKLDVAPEPGVPLGPDCACEAVDLEGELKGIEETARRMGYGSKSE